MSGKVIRLLKKEFNLPIRVCGNCGGGGEITTFSGHSVEETCRKCKGKGYTPTREMYKRRRVP